jgi:hypothetical protein
MTTVFSLEEKVADGSRAGTSDVMSFGARYLPVLMR